MYSIIPLILILISFLIIFGIIARRFPALAILDVENIPEEKTAKIKEKIIKERISRDWSGKLETWSRFWGNISNWFLSISKKLHELRISHQEKRQLSKVSVEIKIETLLQQAREAVRREDSDDLEEAERKLIEVVSLDDKHFEAFFELGEVYYKMKKYVEAKQTWLYALRLLELRGEKDKESEVLFSLSEVNEILGEYAAARDNLQDAINISPNNPRYLDSILNLCIIEKDKVAARKYFAKLAEVNPENQKLEEIKEQIEELGK